MSDKSTEEALRLEFLVKVRDDPVLFARSFIPDPIKPGQMFNPFPYQEEWLRSTNKRLIAVCVPPWTRVLTKEGEHKIKDIRPGDFVITYRGREKRVIAVLSRPYRGLLYVITDGKRRLNITPEHPLLSKINGRVGWNEGRILFERFVEGCRIEIRQINACSEGIYRGAFGWRRISLSKCGLAKEENFEQPDLAGYPIHAASFDQPKITQQQNTILASKDIGGFCYQAAQARSFGGFLDPIGEGDVIRTPAGTFTVSPNQKRSCKSSTEGLSYIIQTNGEPRSSDFDGNVEKPFRFEGSDCRNQFGRSIGQTSSSKEKQQEASIYATKYDGEVFNLIVEDDESYIAESFVAHNCGRQVGKSTIAAIALIHFAMCNPKTTSIIVSSSLRQSMETFDKVVMFLYGSVLESSVASHTRTRIMFKNGARIICLPCGRYGFSLRGLTVHFAVLDEAAFMPEEVISNVVFPMLATTNGILWMLTTPWSKDHISYRAYAEITRPAEERRWDVFHLPSRVSPMITQDFLDEQLRLNGQDVFEREYLANFIDVAGSFFPTALLNKAIHHCEKQPCPFCAQYHNPTPGTRLFGGYDPGGRDSYAAFVEIERLDGPKYAIRDCIQDKVKPNEADPRFYTRFTVQISDKNKVLHFSNIGIDTTATQQSINEHMTALGMRTKGFNFSQAVKEGLATRFKINLEQGTLELPDDIVLLSALNCIEAERTPSGGFKFSHRNGTYDDLGWAAMLALAVATEANEPSPGGVVLG